MEKKPIIFLPPLSSTLMELKESFIGNETIELFEPVNIDEGDQLSGVIKGALWVASDPRMAINFMSLLGENIKVNESKFLLITLQGTLDSYKDQLKKSHIVDTIGEPLPAKTVQYKVNLLIKALPHPEKWTQKLQEPTVKENLTKGPPPPRQEESSLRMEKLVTNSNSVSSLFIEEPTIKKEEKKITPPQQTPQRPPIILNSPISMKPLFSEEEPKEIVQDHTSFIIEFKTNNQHFKASDDLINKEESKSTITELKPLFLEPDLDIKEGNLFSPIVENEEESKDKISFKISPEEEKREIHSSLIVENDEEDLVITSLEITPNLDEDHKKKLEVEESSQEKKKYSLTVQSTTKKHPHLPLALFQDEKKTTRKAISFDTPSPYENFEKINFDFDHGDEKSIFDFELSPSSPLIINESKKEEEIKTPLPIIVDTYGLEEAIHLLHQKKDSSNILKKIALIIFKKHHGLTNFLIYSPLHNRMLDLWIGHLEFLGINKKDKNKVQLQKSWEIIKKKHEEYWVKLHNPQWNNIIENYNSFHYPFYINQKRIGLIYIQFKNPVPDFDRSLINFWAQLAYWVYWGIEEQEKGKNLPIKEEVTQLNTKWPWWKKILFYIKKKFSKKKQLGLGI